MGHDKRKSGHFSVSNPKVIEIVELWNIHLDSKRVADLSGRSIKTVQNYIYDARKSGMNVKRCEPVSNRFFEIGIRSESGCLEWPLSCVFGYGQIVVSGKRYVVHRYSWELTHGPISDPQMCVCHKCDNRKCYEPSHLFLGTRLDNARDMVAKKRNNVGEDHINAVHSNAKILYMLQLYRAGYGAKEIAQFFEMRHGDVSRIIDGKRWPRIGEREWLSNAG